MKDRDMKANCVSRGVGFARQILTCALFLLVLSGCTNAVHRPVFPDNEPGQSVRPLSSYFPKTSVDGTHARPVVKMFLVHGMTHSDPTWADGLIQRIAARLHITVEGCAMPIPIITSSSRGHPAQLCVYAGADADIDYRFYSLQWSPLTDPFKCMAPFLRDRDDGDPIKANGKNLCQNPNNLHYPVRRGLINGRLIKDVVLDDGFPDVMLYLAPQYWPVIRDAVSAALCYMYSASPEQPCVPDNVPTPPSTEQYVFITHSLGANVLLDTLCEQLQCADTHPSAPPLAANLRNLGHAIETSLARSTPFYMLANQYVLLELRKAVPLAELSFAAAQVPAFLDIRNHPLFTRLRPPRREDRLDRAADSANTSIDIVAFSDPNDDLSFLLPPFPRGDTHPFITVQNVLVQNATEYLWLLENPLTAHVGYYHDPERAGILDVIFCGMTTDGVTKC